MQESNPGSAARKLDTLATRPMTWYQSSEQHRSPACYTVFERVNRMDGCTYSNYFRELSVCVLWYFGVDILFCVLSGWIFVCFAVVLLSFMCDLVGGGGGGGEVVCVCVCTCLSLIFSLCCQMSGMASGTKTVELFCRLARCMENIDLLSRELDYFLGYSHEVNVVISASIHNWQVYIHLYQSFVCN